MLFYITANEKTKSYNKQKKYYGVKNMVKAYQDYKLNNRIRDILNLLYLGESNPTVQELFDQHIRQVRPLDIFLILQELKRDDTIITMKEIQTFFNVYENLYGHSLLAIPVPNSDHPGHPIQMLKRENEELEAILTRIYHLLHAEDPNHKSDELQEEMKQLGQFYSHYNRKEKLYFPILERYGIFNPCRMMWADDDRIRTLYKGTKRMMEKMADIEFPHIKEAFQDLDKAIRDMFLQEKYLLLPIAQSIFQEKDWVAIPKESKAFGYVGMEPVETWMPKGVDDVKVETESTDTEHFRFGGGYLTIKEANHILNSLPLELTFVDKNGIFKYFNEVVESSEMMFIRTPTSIGRNVKMCHPPKSMRKVMQVIQDLRWKKRSSETMWFKKKGQYVHITYKGIFDENGEFLGILEYVQDIQPFFELPRDVKKEVSRIDI